MMRSLWTAASGMIAQQTNVDNIANNLANVNTTGYKTSTVEFKTLLYQNIQTKTTTANGEQKPIGAQVGLGVRNSSVTTHFTDGALLASENPYAYAITGDGLFAVTGVDGGTYYTRNGNFQLALSAWESNLEYDEETFGELTEEQLEKHPPVVFCTSEGYPVLDENSEPMIVPRGYDSSKITINSDGEVCYPDSNGNLHEIGLRIGLYQFANPSGLEKVSDSLYSESGASGVAVEESSDPSIKKSKINQGYLEGSNVQVVDEMVNLITAQRAYEMNSKAIQAADDMLGQANQLKRS